MGHDIVGIIRTRAVIAEVSYGRSRCETADKDAITAIVLPCRTLEHAVEIVPPERAAFAIQRIAYRRLVRDDERVLVDLSQVHVDDVVAQRVIEGCADHLDTRRQFRVRGGIDLDLIELTLRIRHAKPRLYAAAFPGRHDPSLERDAIQTIRAPHDLFEAHPGTTDAIGKPARIRNLVDGVDVERTHVSPLTRIAKRVDEKVVAVSVFDDTYFGGVQRAIVIGPQRIVRVESWTRGSQVAGAERDQHDAARDCRAPKTRRQRRCRGACHHGSRTQRPRERRRHCLC